MILVPKQQPRLEPHCHLHRQHLHWRDWEFLPNVRGWRRPIPFGVTRLPGNFQCQRHRLLEACSRPMQQPTPSEGMTHHQLSLVHQLQEALGAHLEGCSLLRPLLRLRHVSLEEHLEGCSLLRTLAQLQLDHRAQASSLPNLPQTPRSHK